jgi:hypothetical protein
LGITYEGSNITNDLGNITGLDVSVCLFGIGNDLFNITDTFLHVFNLELGSAVRFGLLDGGQDSFEF